MTPPNAVFGTNLAHERKRQCHTMRSLAKAADMHASEISRLEHAQRDPRLSTVARIARALDVPLYDLLRGIE